MRIRTGFIVCFRYQREFGFTISGRPIIVDDIRVRGIGKTELDLETSITEAAGPPKVETVSTCRRFHSLLL